MANDIRYIINRYIIIDIYPPTLFSHIFPNPKNQISFVVAQKSLLVCLLVGRSQSLKRYFFLVFLVIKKINSKCEEKSDGFYRISFNKIIWVRDILNFSGFAAYGQ